MPIDYNELINLINLSGEIIISLNNETGDIVLGGEGADGDITIRNSSGEDRIRIDGNSGEIRFINNNGVPGVTISRFGRVDVGNSGNSGIITLRDQNNDAKISLRANNSRISLNNDTNETILLNGSTGDIIIGGEDADGDITIRNSSGEDRIRIDGNSGEMRLLNNAGSPGVTLSRFGRVNVGSSSTAGRIDLRGQNNELKISLEARGSRISLENDKVVIDGENGSIDIGPRSAGIRMIDSEGIQMLGAGVHTFMRPGLLYHASPGPEDEARFSIRTNQFGTEIVLRNVEEISERTINIEGRNGRIYARDRIQAPNIFGNELTLARSGTTSILLDGLNSRMTIGGRITPTPNIPGQDGRISLRDRSNTETIILDGGTGMVTAANISDFAEEFDVNAEDYKNIVPGCVLVLDQNGKLKRCNIGYDTKVIGVVSGAGDYRPGIIMDKHEDNKFRLPIAMIGKAMCYVDAKYGEIGVGDLLTTSETPGYAKKATKKATKTGSIIGKALQPLSKGKGLVLTLVSIQ